MQSSKLIQILYTLSLGVLIALFIGVGISTFYEGPDSPDYTPGAEIVSTDSDTEIEKQATQHQRDYEIYESRLEVYNRNVSMIALVAAVVSIGGAIFLERRIKIIASGIMLGGLFTLLYSIGQGFGTDDSRYVFVLLSASLVIVFYLGYRHFLRAEPRQKKRS